MDNALTDQLAESPQLKTKARNSTRGLSLYIEKIKKDEGIEESEEDKLKKEIGTNAPIRRTVLLTKEMDDN